MTQIIISDLVPLAKRGLYQGMMGLVYAFASAIGPPLARSHSYSKGCHNLTAVLIQGGAFTEKATWRWLFCEY